MCLPSGGVWRWRVLGTVPTLALALIVAGEEALWSVRPPPLDNPNLRCDCDEETLQYTDRKNLTGYLTTFVEIAAHARLVKSPSCRLVQDPRERRSIHRFGPQCKRRRRRILNSERPIQYPGDSSDSDAISTC